MKIAQVVNSALVVLAAVAVATWSVLANPLETSELSQEWQFEGLDFNEQIESLKVESLARNGRDSIVLMAGSSAELQWDEETNHVDVLLTSGGVLFGTQANDFSVTVHTATVQVDSQESFAYVERDEDGNVRVYGLSHPSLLTFVESGNPLNALFVPDGMMIEVPASKVSSTLSRLRLTKLSKEFRASEIKNEDLSAAVIASWSDVKLRYTESAVSYQQDLQNDLQLGPVKDGLGAKLYAWYDGFRDTATVIPTAELRLEESRKDTMLQYAMSNLLFGDSARGDSWVDEWTVESHTLEELEALYSDLFFVLPGDDLYSVKLATGDLVFDQDSTLASLRRQFLDIERLLDRGESVEAQSALRKYQSQLSEALDAGLFDNEEMLAGLGREYLLVELLLRENSDFYNVEYVGLLTEIEDKILSLAGDDNDLDEERQAFVLSKIQFLTKLFEFVVDRRVSIDDATDLANELLFTAEGYMTLIPSDVAVRDWYKSELEKADLAILFMNSPEFYSYSDFDEGLEAYELKVQDLEDLQAYIQQIREGEGDLEASITLDEALEEVRQAFTFNAISYLNAESHGDAAYRLFTIEAGKVDAYEFTASYDREGGLLYDLVIEEQIRFSTGVLLEDLRDVIEQSLSETPLEEEEELVVSESSLTEDLAVHQVEEAFDEAGLDLDDFTFELVDLETDTFSFEGVITRYSLDVSGQYNLETGKVSNVVWLMDEEEQSLPGMALTQLEAAIEAVHSALSS